MNWVDTLKGVIGKLLFQKAPQYLHVLNNLWSRPHKRKVISWVIVGCVIMGGAAYFFITTEKIRPAPAKPPDTPSINITKIIIAAGLGTNQVPFGVDTNFSSGNKRLYFYVSYNGAIPNRTLFVFKWYQNDDQINEAKFTIKYASGNIWNYLDYDFQPGQYQVQVHANGRQLGMTFFKVSTSDAQRAEEQQRQIKAEADIDAERLIGNWSGTAYLPIIVHGLFGSFAIDRSDSYLATMKLSGVDGGSVDYRSVDYPSFSCGGSLTFAEERNGSFYYTERITYGKDKCIDGGKVEVLPSGNAVHYGGNFGMKPYTLKRCTETGCVGPR